MVDRTLTMNEVYEKEIAEMQRTNHQLMIRIKELNEEIARLRKILENRKNA